MHYLRVASNAILLIGICVAVAATVFDLGPLLTLVGLMMVIAGVVKIITVRIWAGFFDGEETSHQ
jgi:hypothetical protein